MEYSNEFEEGQLESISDIPPITLSDVKSVVTMGTDWTSETIIGQILKRNIDLDPEFQRREVWSVEQKSRFIESLIIGIPVPQIVLAEDLNHNGRYIVIDGKQRLITLCQFTADNNSKYRSFKLKGLEVCPELNGKTYADIYADVNLQHHIFALENSSMRSVVVKNWFSESVLYNIFLRLNSNSVQLSPQELRQALCPGDFVSYLDVTSGDSEGLRVLLNNKKPDYRMRDAEILLRFIAFEFFPKSYKGNLKPFLDDACHTLNKKWKSKEFDVVNMVRAFESSCSFLEENLPKTERYRKWNPDTRKFSPRYNRAVFEIMVSSCLDPKVQQALVGKGEDIIALFKQLCERDQSFMNSLTSTLKSTENNPVSI